MNNDQKQRKFAISQPAASFQIFRPGGYVAGSDESRSTPQVQRSFVGVAALAGDMRGAVFCAIIALWALIDGTSAVARAGGTGPRAGKSRGSSRRSDGSSSVGDRDRSGKTTKAARRRRGNTVPSHDGAQNVGRDSVRVVVGAVREERGHQVKRKSLLFGRMKRFMSFFFRGATNNQRPEIMRTTLAPSPGRSYVCGLAFESFPMHERTVIYRGWCLKPY